MSEESRIGVRMLSILVKVILVPDGQDIACNTDHHASIFKTATSMKMNIEMEIGAVALYRVYETHWLCLLQFCGNATLFPQTFQWSFNSQTPKFFITPDASLMDKFDDQYLQ